VCLEFWWLFSFANAMFEMNAEEGLDLVDELFTETGPMAESATKLNFSHEVQQGLKQSVISLN